MALSRIGAQRADVRHRQGEVYGDSSSSALRYRAAVLGSMVGAKAEAMRPSYGGLGLVAALPEAGLPSMEWALGSGALT